MVLFLDLDSYNTCLIYLDKYNLSFLAFEKQLGQIIFYRLKKV